MGRKTRQRASQRVQRSKRNRNSYGYPVSERELFILTYESGAVPEWPGGWDAAER